MWHFEAIFCVQISLSGLIDFDSLLFIMAGVQECGWEFTFSYHRAERHLFQCLSWMPGTENQNRLFDIVWKMASAEPEHHGDPARSWPVIFHKGGYSKLKYVFAKCESHR